MGKRNLRDLFIEPDQKSCSKMLGNVATLKDGNIAFKCGSPNQCSQCGRCGTPTKSARVQ